VLREVKVIQGGNYLKSSVEALQLIFMSTCYFLADLRVTDASRLRAYDLKANDRICGLLRHVRRDNLRTYKFRGGLVLLPI
jgi:hypothetical protein